MPLPSLLHLSQSFFLHESKPLPTQPLPGHLWPSSGWFPTQTFPRHFNVHPNEPVAVSGKLLGNALWCALVYLRGQGIWKEKQIPGTYCHTKEWHGFSTPWNNRILRKLLTLGECRLHVPKQSYVWLGETEESPCTDTSDGRNRVTNGWTGKVFKQGTEPRGCWVTVLPLTALLTPSLPLPVQSRQPHSQSSLIHTVQAKKWSPFEF